MRAGAVVAGLAEIAVVTEQLERRGESVADDPTVEHCGDTVLPATTLSVVVDVVDGEKQGLALPAARTAVAVPFEYDAT